MGVRGSFLHPRFLYIVLFFLSRGNALCFLFCYSKGVIKELEYLVSSNFPLDGVERIWLRSEGRVCSSVLVTLRG